MSLCSRTQAASFGCSATAERTNLMSDMRLRPTPARDTRASEHVVSGLRNFSCRTYVMV